MLEVALPPKLPLVPVLPLAMDPLAGLLRLSSTLRGVCFEGRGGYGRIGASTRNIPGAAYRQQDIIIKRRLQETRGW